MKSSFVKKLATKINAFTQCIGQILVYAFTIKYEFTSVLIGKMIWPFFLFLGIFVFKSEIKDLATEITKKIPYANTLAITADGIQIAVNKSNIIDTKNNIEEFEIISQLTGEEIVFLVENSESTTAFMASEGFKKDQSVLDRLKELGLYEIDYEYDKDPDSEVYTNPKSDFHNKKFDVFYQSTPLGDDVRQTINQITTECFVNGCIFEKE
jgi:hypothetical protein